METNISIAPVEQEQLPGNKINYLWLNGERVIGIEGLEVFQDCRQMQHIPAMDESQRTALNNIINDTILRHKEEGISDHWPDLLLKAREYFSEQGFCVVKKDNIKIELRQLAGLPIVANELLPAAGSYRKLTNADLWNIHRLRKIRSTRRFIG